MTEMSVASTRWNLRRCHFLPDLVGISWLVAVGIALLVPALLHGTHIGTYDLLAENGLSKRPGVIPHNLVNNDQIDSMIPWTNLVWTQVHEGHLPLWNPYNGLGLPLAFNWQSAPLGLPALIGYLMPVQYAYDVGIFVTLIVAGTGVYVLGRLLGLGAISCAFAGTVFELSGPLIGWIGYPHGEVMSWAGWLFAAAVLVMRQKRRARNIAIFAVVLAMTIYSGQPEVLAVFVLALILFVAIVMVLRTPLAKESGPIMRPVADLSIATVAGVALAAPLAIPGFQAISQSTRSVSGSVAALPTHDLIYFIAQGFDGLPIAGSTVFGQSFFYEETAAYVGIIAVTLAVFATTIRFRRPEVVALAIVTAIMVGIVFVPPINSLMNHLPILRKVIWDRALMAVSLGVAVLSGFGLDALVRSYAERTTRRRAAACFIATGSALLIIFLVGRGSLPPVAARIRATSFVGPAVGIAAGMLIVLMLTMVNRRYRSTSPAWLGSIAGVTLLVLETAFLLSSGVPILSSSSTYLTPTKAELSLKEAVGTDVVGFGVGSCGQLGIEPSVNSVFGVYEFDAYDPIIPASYYTAWTANTGTPTGISILNDFCPVISTDSEARLYGVSFVLVHEGSAGPKGSVFVKDVGGEALYHVPNSGIATLTSVAPSGAMPPVQAEGVPITVNRPDPAVWKIRTSEARAQVLRLRLTDVPGWHATLDGKPLRLYPYAGVMLQALIPAGHHTIELHYWPSTLTLGIVIAAIGGGGLLIALIVERMRRNSGITA